MQRLDRARRCAIAITNRGYFVVFDPRRVAAVDRVYR
jgi:hypothetical protein